MNPTIAAIIIKAVIALPKLSSCNKIRNYLHSFYLNIVSLRLLNTMSRKHQILMEHKMVPKISYRLELCRVLIPSQPNSLYSDKSTMMRW